MKENDICNDFSHWIGLYLLMIYTVIIPPYDIYRQTSNISRTSVGNEIVDHSDVIGALPVGTVPTTSSFST